MDGIVQFRKKRSRGTSHTQKVWGTSIIAMLCEYARVWCDHCLLSMRHYEWICSQNLDSIWTVNSVFTFSGMSILIHHALSSTAGRCVYSSWVQQYCIWLHLLPLYVYSLMYCAYSSTLYTLHSTLHSSTVRNDSTRHLSRTELCTYIM